MNIRIENINGSVTLDKSNFIAAGGEGEIYILPPDKLIKLYHEVELTSIRQEKVLDLCSKYETFRGLFCQTQYAFPEIPANRINIGKENNNEIVGFTMNNLGTSHPKLYKLIYKENEFQKNKDGLSLTTDTAIALIYDLYECLHKLHTSRIILGDLNPLNILYNFNTHKPCFVDIDSAQIGKYSCLAKSDNYLDPLVEENGMNSDNVYKYSTTSDYYSMAVIVYELFVGQRPFSYRTTPGMYENDRRLKRLALIGQMKDQNFLKRMGGGELVDQKMNTLHLQRLNLLRSKAPLLYQYLFDTFILDKRESLLNTLPKNDCRNPKYVFYAKTKVKTIVDVLKEIPKKTLWELPKTETWDKEDIEIFEMMLRKHNIRRYVVTSDPEMFKKYVSNFGIDYQELVQNGVQSNA